MLGDPLSPTMAAAWLVAFLATDGAHWESGNSDLFVTYDAPRTDPATTDATVAGDCGWPDGCSLLMIPPSSKTTAVPRLNIVFLSGAPSTPSLLLATWRTCRSYGGSSQSQCLSSCSPGGVPLCLCTGCNLLPQQVGGLYSLIKCRPFLIRPASISPIGFKFLYQARPVRQML